MSEASRPAAVWVGGAPKNSPIAAHPASNQPAVGRRARGSLIGRVGDYPALRKPVIERVVAKVEHATRIARGQTRGARAVRLLAPALALLLPLAAQRATRFVLGLEHEIGVEPWTPDDPASSAET